MASLGNLTGRDNPKSLLYQEHNALLQKFDMFAYLNRQGCLGIRSQMTLHIDCKL